jgi:hypothetical protein
MGWLSDMLRGGRGELGWEDLIKRVVDAIAPLKQYGPKGLIVFPVVVRITVGGGSVDVVQGFVDRPDLDQSIGAALANRWDLPIEELPVREYVVSAADRTSFTATEGVPKTWRLVIAGGDLDGRALDTPARWTELAFGRGPWHGGDQSVQNDLIVADTTEFVSRRAGRLYRAGAHLEVAALDQGDELVVRRPGGEALRPARTARGRVAVRAGDAIELGDGRGKTVRLVVERVAR